MNTLLLLIVLMCSFTLLITPVTSSHNQKAEGRGFLGELFITNGRTCDCTPTVCQCCIRKSTRFLTFKKKICTVVQTDPAAHGYFVSLSVNGEMVAPQQHMDSLVQFCPKILNGMCVIMDIVEGMLCSVLVRDKKLKGRYPCVDLNMRYIVLDNARYYFNTILGIK